MRSRMRESASTDLREPQGSNPLGPPGPELNQAQAPGQAAALSSLESRGIRSVVNIGTLSTHEAGRAGLDGVAPFLGTKGPVSHPDTPDTQKTTYGET